MTFTEYLAEHAIDLGALLILAAYVVIAKIRGHAR